jgi:cytochrome c peroxidase
MFRPDRVTVVAGAPLRIENDDTRKHNVRVSAPGLDINSGIQSSGETVTLTFPEPGRYEAFCGIHPRMKLVVDVTEG